MLLLSSWFSCILLERGKARLECRSPCSGSLQATPGTVSVGFSSVTKCDIINIEWNHAIACRIIPKKNGPKSRRKPKSGSRVILIPIHSAHCYAEFLSQKNSEKVDGNMYGVLLLQQKVMWHGLPSREWLLRPRDRFYPNACYFVARILWFAITSRITYLDTMFIA